MGSSTGERFQSGSHSFSHGVDGIGAHGVPAIDQEVDHQHGPHGRAQTSSFDAFAAASKGDHSGRYIVAKGNQFSRCSVNCTFSGVEIFDI